MPLQEFNNGSVTLQVMEGCLGKVSIEGTTRTRLAVIVQRAYGFKSGDIYLLALLRWRTVVRRTGQRHLAPGPDGRHGEIFQGGQNNTGGFLTSEWRRDSDRFAPSEVLCSFGTDKALSAGWFLDGGKVRYKPT